MNYKIIAQVLCFAAATLSCSMGQVPTQPSSSADTTSDLTVTVGKTILLDLPKPIVRVAVGLGDFAVASVITKTEIMVNGKAPGETSLIIWEAEGGRQVINLTVRASSAASKEQDAAIRRELKKELPGESIQVDSEKGTLFLRGTVKNLNKSERAVEIASMGGKVVNLLNIEVPAAEPQIMLKVMFASIDRSLANQLGINLFSLGLGNTIGGITTGQFSPPFLSGTSGSAGSNNALATSSAQAMFSNELNLLAFFPGLKSGADIQALETKGLVEVLAQPNIIAENGKQASFLAGGEYPYPVVQGGSGGAGSSVSIQFKQYGIRLNFIPVITPRGSIHLQVAPEVSSLDFTNAVQVSGFNVPAIATRKMNTEVDLKEGQSFVIGGLLDNRETKTFQQIPFLGSVPILGKFFQSMVKNRTNTELLVIVTPQIVSPIQAGEPLPKLTYPESFLPANSVSPVSNPNQMAPQTPQQTVPVEVLKSSMAPEQPLMTDGSVGGYGSGSAGSSGRPASSTDLFAK